MALIKFGGGITEMRGSMAGNVYSRNKSGAYIRARTTPVNPQSAQQTIVRAVMAALTVRWSQTLTAAQRTAWNLYGASVAMTNKLGESIFLSGFNHYIRSNAWLERVNFTQVDAGPVVFEIPDADPTFAITASEATQAISFTFDTALAWANEDEAYMELYQGQPQNAQRNFFNGPWRYVAAVSGDSGAPPVSPAAPQATIAIAEGQHLWCYARIRRADGRLSAPFRHDVLVGA